MVITRFDKMQGAQQPFQAEWDVCDQQFEAEIIEDPYTGQVLINTNLEQALIETEVGRIANQIVFDVKPAGYKASSYQLESGKYVLQSFLDKENFYDTFRTRKQDKARYGTGVWFTGLRYDIEFIPTYEKQTVETEL